MRVTAGIQWGLFSAFMMVYGFGMGGGFSAIRKAEAEPATRWRVTLYTHGELNGKSLARVWTTTYEPRIRGGGGLYFDNTTINGTYVVEKVR